MNEFVVEPAPGFWVFWGALVFVLGTCLGSFLNVCILRMPEEESIVSPPSHCPHCENPIRWYDNLPIISYLLLRGRCRNCGTSISPQYVLVEALTGLLFLGLLWRWGIHPVLFPYGVLVAGLIVATFIDLKHFIIPDEVSLGGIPVGLLLSLGIPALHGAAGDHWQGLLASSFGLVMGSGTLWLVGFVGTLIFRKEAMGLGDVKLLGMIGTFIGWQGVAFTIVVSSLIGTVIGVSLIMVGGRDWQSRIPYGPYLALAALLWLFGGEEIWRGYWEVVGAAS